MTTAEISPEVCWAAHDQYQDQMPIWTIYDTATGDFPGVWVARMYLGLPKPTMTRFILTATSLEDLRLKLPPGLYCMERHETGDARIVESWL